MMRRQVRMLTLFAAAVFAALVQTNVAGQVYIRSEPVPLVTAENEPWYLAGEPITYSGSLYYPAGPQVFFDAQEMVRTGDYRGIPLYARTTIEPFSKVFVPLAGRLMQPYERRRSGELAGTVGSTAPSFPIATAGEDVSRDVYAGIPQAAAPPMQVDPVTGTVEDVRSAAMPSEAMVPAPTAGTLEIDRVRGPLTTAQKPEGLNAVFIEFRDRRWFSSGPALELDEARFVRIGDYRGFPVYTEKDREDSTIYVTVGRHMSNLVAPYAVGR
jgi:hypothetical protein